MYLSHIMYRLFHFLVFLAIRVNIPILTIYPVLTQSHTNTETSLPDKISSSSQHKTPPSIPPIYSQQ